MSSIESLKQAVYEANMRLPHEGLVILTWGNVSAVDRDKNLMVIKPSGVDYEKMKPEDMVVVDLDTGKSIDSDLNPSSDTPTHLALYRAFKDIGAIVHTHSPNATIWAQAGRDIPAYGTTHVDYFCGDIPCTRKMTTEEIHEDYETNTGNVIIETFEDINPLDIPAVVVYSHGPFTWGENLNKAVENAVVLEQIAKMATQTELLGNKTPIQNDLLEKHYLRKHGANAYYGQKKK